MKIYTRKGDDGTTGLYFGGRLRKDDAAVEAYGTVDEAQSFLGVARAEARAEAGAGSDMDGRLVAIERDLWVLMADMATGDDNRDKLEAGKSLVTEEMVVALERQIDELNATHPMPTEFVVPGQNRLAAALDVARTVVRRAERLTITAKAGGEHVVPYLNRLSDLLWTLGRVAEGESLPTRTQEPR